MTATSQPSNGNGYTQKEMLARIEAKLDVIAGKMEALQIEFAVHEAQPFHLAAKAEMETIRDEQKAAMVRLATIAGGIAVGAFVVGILVRLIG